MKIEDIEKAKYTFKKDLKKIFKRFMLFFVLNEALMVLGGFIFYCTENCYETVPAPYPSTSTLLCIGLCDKVGQLTVKFSNDSNVAETLRNISTICGSCPIHLENSTTSPSCNFIGTMDLLYWRSYAFTVSFTIGYGQIVTKTDLGKSLTIIYALVAIPVATASLVFCGRFISNAIKLLLVNLESKLLRRRQVVWFQRKIIFIQTMITILILFVYSIYILKITGTDNISFMDAFYLVFVTVSTIGFGDINMNKSDMQRLSYFYQVLLGLVNYVFFYMAISMVASIVSALTNLQTESSFKKIRMKSKVGQKARAEERF